MKEARKAVGITLLAVIAVAAIWWFSFGAKILGSAPIGQGNAIIQNNSAENWTRAQAKFEDLYAGIEAADRKIAIAAEALERDSDDTISNQNYDGARMVCEDLVGDYNAEARKFLSGDWRAVDLPYQIDSRQPSTDCKE